MATYTKITTNQSEIIINYWRIGVETIRCENACDMSVNEIMNCIQNSSDKIAQDIVAFLHFEQFGVNLNGEWYEYNDWNCTS